MIALERGGSITYHGSWTQAFQERIGLLGNQQPQLPCAIPSGTLREVEYAKPTLLKYQIEGSESGALDGDVWKITTTAKDISLAAAKEIALQEISQKRFDVETGGIIANNKFYATDRHSQAAIDRASGTVSWKVRGTVARNVKQDDGSTASKTFYTGSEFASTDMSSLKSVVKSHVSDAYSRESELLTAINAASDVAALRAIDLDAGWAAIPQNDPGE